MKILAYIRLTIRGIVRNFPQLFLSLSLLPIGLVFIIGYFINDSTVKTTLPTIEIAIEDKDQTELSEQLVSFLAEEREEFTIKVLDNDYNYQLIIPEGYENAVKKQEEIDLSLRLEDRGSSSNADILINIIESYHKAINKGVNITNKLENKKLSQNQKNNRLININSQLNNINQIELFQYNEVEIKKIFNNYENLSISMYSFSFILLVMVFLAGNFMEKEIGLFNRINATPITRTEYYNLSLLCTFIGIFVFSTLYVLVLRFAGVSFNGDMSHLLIIQVAISFMGTGLVGLLWAFTSKNKSMILLNFIIIIQMLLNGGILDLNSFGDNTILVSLSKY
ncbi:MAG: ABC transporter permease, partial [Eubacteriales bacterium]